MESTALRITLDLRSVSTTADLHHALQTAFAFPAYYGCNWDAFWDCITSLDDRVLVLDILGYAEACSRLGQQMEMFLNLLDDFRHSRQETLEINFRHTEKPAASFT